MENKTWTCPHCGSEIKISAKSCPNCGSDENTGWSDNTYLDGIDLGDGFDYEEITSQEFTNKKKISWTFVVAIVLLMVIAFIWIFK